MQIKSKYHVGREEIEAELAEIESARKNPKNFAPLYNRYYARVLGFVFQRVHAREDAYDITQQVFMSALEQIGKYKYMGVPFSAWLFRIALNELARSYRRGKVRQAVNIDDLQVDTLLGELEQENTSQTDSLLMRTIAQLNAEDVMLLELHFFEGRAFKEIAEILNIQEAAAKARVYRLLERMKIIFISFV
jgi:RNA polymerase sigma-70 factor (ECF subfamily)